MDLISDQLGILSRSLIAMTDFCLLHGLGLSKEIWNLITPLFKSDDEIYAPDLLGHGDNFGPSSELLFDMRAVWLDIEPFLKTNKKPKIFVLHSMASAFIPYIIETDLDLRAIILLEGNLISEDANLSRKISRMTFNEFLIWMKFVGDSLFWKNEPEVSALLIESLKNTNPAALYFLSKDLVRLTDDELIIKSLKHREFPVFYLRGSRSEASSRLKKELNNLNIGEYQIDGSGHMMMIENPHTTQQIIKKISKEL